MQKGCQQSQQSSHTDFRHAGRLMMVMYWNSSGLKEMSMLSVLSVLSLLPLPLAIKGFAAAECDWQQPMDVCWKLWEVVDSITFA